MMDQDELIVVFVEESIQHLESIEPNLLEMEKDIGKISAYAMSILQKYTFPGNVRELENIVERSAALESSNIVLPGSLTLSNLRTGRAPSEICKNRPLDPNGIQLDEVMAEIEKGYVTQAIEMAKGSKQRAADLLGINLRSLRYRLEKL